MCISTFYSVKKTQHIILISGSWNINIKVYNLLLLLLATKEHLVINREWSVELKVKVRESALRDLKLLFSSSWISIHCKNSLFCVILKNTW